MLRSLVANITSEEIINTALQYIGAPVIKHSSIRDDPFNQGNNPNGFDCSGFWQYLLLLKKINLFVPVLNRNIRYTREFFDFLGESVTWGKHKKGDLVFFSRSGRMPSHMGMCIGGNKIIHKGFLDVSLVPMISTGNYPKRIIMSCLDVVSADRRTAGVPIKPRYGLEEQKYFTNPIGFKRFIGD